MKKIDLAAKLAAAPFFDVVDTTGDGQVAVMCLAPGRSSGPDLNAHDAEVQYAYIVEGEGVLQTDKGETPVAAGDLLVIEPGEPNRLTNTGTATLKTVDVYAPPAY